MCLCYKTTKGNKVSVDYQYSCYDWNDVREYVRGDSNECKVYMNLGRDYINIDETGLESHEISYLLGDTEFMDDFDMDEQMERNMHIKDIEDENLIIYFKVRDLGSHGLNLNVVTNPEEANGFIIRKKKEDEEYPVEDMKETLNYFRAYIEGSFVEISIYSPKTYIAEKNPTEKIIKYEYEDGGMYFRSNEEAIASIDESVWGKVLKETESENFSMREY